MANGNEGDIVLTITLDDGSIVKGIATAEKAAKDSGKNIEGSFQKNIGGGFSFLNKQILALGASFAAAFAGKKIIDAAASQQAAVAKLNQSLISAGSFSQDASKSFIQLADNIQKTTTTSDDAALSALALSRNFTKTNEQAQSLTKAALDLSAATGQTLETSVEQLGATFSGTAGRLTKLVPSLQGLTENQLRAGAAVDVVAAKFEGFAKAEVNTFNGALKQAANSFDDVLESLGNIVINSPSIAAAFKFVSGEFNKLTAGISGISGDPFKAILLGAADVARFFVTILGPVIDFIVNRFVIFGNTLGALGSVISQLLNGEFATAIETFKEGVVGEFFSIEKSIELSGTNSALGFINGFKTAVETAPPLTPVLENKIIAPLQAVTLTAGSLLGALFDNINNKALATTQTIDDLTKTLRGSLVSGIASAFSALGSALARGENGFSAFGKAVLSAMGGIAIQIGTVLVSAGLGWSLIPGFQASAGAIPAGLGLIVLGGALQALGGGGASVPVSGGGVSSGGGGTQTSAAPIDTGVADLQEVGPQIAVNIQGNILDRRQTGLEIADILRESFDGNAVVFNV